MEGFQKIENLAVHIKEYVDTRISIIKLGVAEKASKLVAWMIAAVLLFFILLFFLVFLSLAAAHVIGNALGHSYLGFLTVGGIYLLLALFVWWRKEKLLRIPLMNLIVRQLFSEETEENEKI